MTDYNKIEMIKMVITKINIECGINLGNYETCRVSVEGETKEEVREMIIDTLNDFGTCDPEIRNRINSYVKRVLSKPESPKEITCDECEGQDTEACNTCPYQEECNTDNLNALTSDSDKTDPKSEIESGQPKGTTFKKATEVTEKQDTFKTEEEFKKYNETETIENPYDNGMPKATCCECGAPLTITDLRLSDLLGIDPCCKECRDKIRGKEE